VLAASDAESQIQVPFEAVGPNVALAFETNAGRVTLTQQVQAGLAGDFRGPRRRPLAI